MSTSSTSLPLGFRWSAATAGIKASGRPDLALAVADTPASAAALWTSNQVVAAPVIVDRRHMQATGGRIRAVLVNSGNANCATGEPGIEAAHQTCVAAADAIGCVFDEVFPSSTGIIGVPLPTAKLTAAMPAAASALSDSPAALEAFANGILTTDTKAKIARASFESNGHTVNLFGCCKGAGMIGPQLVPHATMLVYLFTDLAAEPAQLQSLLLPAVETSFNAISVDGDMSTNDTVLLLASGASQVTLADGVVPAFEAALKLVCESLAYQVVADGEGVTHVVTLDITGTVTDADATAIAKTIATSPLCKTAWSSADPNWGRLLAAAGRAEVAFRPETVTVTIAGLPVFAHGTRSPAFDEAATHEAMTAHDYVIAMDFGLGQGKARFVTCDLTHEYVSINADYSS